MQTDSYSILCYHEPELCLIIHSAMRLSLTLLILAGLLVGGLLLRPSIADVHATEPGMSEGMAACAPLNCMAAGHCVSPCPSHLGQGVALTAPTEDVDSMLGSSVLALQSPSLASDKPPPRA